MSSYLCFYLRKKNTDTYIPLYSVSRSNSLYQAFREEFGNHIDENGICLPMTQVDLASLHHTIEASLSYYTNRINELELHKKEVGTWNNSVEEKHEKLVEIQANINEWKEEREYTNFAAASVSMLINIEEEQYNCGHPTLYAGIDGCAPDYNEADEE